MGKGFSKRYLCFIYNNTEKNNTRLKLTFSVPQFLDDT